MKFTHKYAYLPPKPLFRMTHKPPKANSTQLVQKPVPSTKKAVGEAAQTGNETCYSVHHPKSGSLPEILM
jgi:hypothetical protein